jgi:O-antigen/teichoic acid export membrane protein
MVHLPNDSKEENKHPKTPVKSSLRALREISLLWVSSLAAAMAAFLTQVILSRLLGPSEYGRLSAAIATTMLAGPFAGFGVGSYWLRAFGVEGWKARRWINPSLRFITVSSVTVCCLLIVWSLSSNQNQATRSLVVWLAPLVVSQALVDPLYARYQLEERYRLLSLWQIVPQGSRFIVAALAMLIGAGLGFVTAGLAIGGILITAFSALSLGQMSRRSFRLAGHGPDPGNKNLPELIPTTRQIIVESWPFAAASLSFLIYFQSSIVLLEWLAGERNAGIYNVAFTVMSGIYLLPSVIYQKYLLPKLHRWAAHDRVRFLAIYRFGNGSMILLGVCIAVLMIALAPVCVPLVFGPEYKQAVGLLLILSICIPMRFLSTSVGGTLVTQDHMRRKVRYMCCVAVANVGLNLILIPRYSIYGAAATTIISEILLLGLYLFGVKEHVFGDDAWCGWNIRIDK